MVRPSITLPGIYPNTPGRYGHHANPDQKSIKYYTQMDIMKRLSLLILLSLVVVVLGIGSPASASIYIDKVTLFEPGTKTVYYNFPGEDITKLTNTAATLSNHGKYDEALVSIDKAIKIDPTLARPYFTKGMILFNMGRYEDAIKAFDWGIKIDPTVKDAKYRAIAASNLTK